jgi:hypothetical protein
MKGEDSYSEAECLPDLESMIRDAVSLAHPDLEELAVSKSLLV